MKNTTWTRWLTLSFLALFFTFVMPITSTINAQELTYDEDLINEALEVPGTLKVGMEANYAPFNWSQTSSSNGAVEISNSPGEYANGYDVQMAVRLAEELNLTLEIIKVDWD